MAWRWWRDFEAVRGGGDWLERNDLWEVTNSNGFMILNWRFFVFFGYSLIGIYTRRYHYIHANNQYYPEDAATCFLVF